VGDLNRLVAQLKRGARQIKNKAKVVLEYVKNEANQKFDRIIDKLG